MPAPCHRRPGLLRRLARRLLARRPHTCACTVRQPVTVTGEGTDTDPYVIDLTTPGD